MKLNHISIVVVLMGLMLACSKNEVPEGTPVDVPSGTPGSPTELTFTMPEGWEREAPLSSMRHSQYRLPGEAGDAELAIFVGIGGSVDQNIERWIGQFSGEDGGSVRDSAKIQQEEVNGMPVTYLDVSGSFAPGMGPMGGSAEPVAGYRMLAAVIETATGPWFLKLTGPEATVTQWEAGFREFVNSAQ